MSRAIILSAENGRIEINIDGECCGSSASAAELAEELAKNNVTVYDNIFCSSSVDFAVEYGFASTEAAEIIVEQAIEQHWITIGAL